MDPLTVCREVLSLSGSNFAHAFRILPSDQRDAMTAFYAFCRVVDDAVDDAEDAAAAGKVIWEWRQRLDLVFEGRAPDPIGRALAWAAGRFGIKKAHLELVLQGVEQDLGVARYETFAGLYEYCYRVASAVGLVCVTVLGRRTREVEAYAELTGVAVQLTNILRDVEEDAAKGRIYLPIEDLRAFGVSEEDILSGRTDRRIRDLLRFEAERAKTFYSMSDAALPPEERPGLHFAEALKEIYRRLLDRLCAEDFPLSGERVSIGKAQKIAIVLKHRLCPPAVVEALR
jgi:phytoene synthase